MVREEPDVQSAPEKFSRLVVLKGRGFQPP
jgi:hypothetical protein